MAYFITEEEKIVSILLFSPPKNPHQKIELFLAFICILVA